MYLKRPDGKPFRVLYLDPETGSVDDYLANLEKDGINLDNLYIVYTQSLKEVNEYINKVTNNEDIYMLDDEGNETDEVLLDADGEPFRADMVVVDGATILNLTTKQGVVEFSKKRAKVKAEKDNLIGDEKFVKVEGAGIELKDYQNINFKGQDLILSLAGCGKHYIVTARETDEKETKEINGKEVTVNTGRKIPDGFKGMAHNAKTVLRFYRDKDDETTVQMYVEKDRTGIFPANEIVTDPSLLVCQTMLDQTKDRHNLVVKNTLNNAVEDELQSIQEDFFGKEETNKEETSGELTIKDVSASIKATLDKLTPIKKDEAKKKLIEKGLPAVKFSTITDINILMQILDVLKSFQ